MFAVVVVVAGAGGGGGGVEIPFVSKTPDEVLDAASGSDLTEASPASPLSCPGADVDFDFFRLLFDDAFESLALRVPSSDDDFDDEEDVCTRLVAEISPPQSAPLSSPASVVASDRT